MATAPHHLDAFNLKLNCNEKVIKILKPREDLFEEYRSAVIESFENNIKEWKPFSPEEYDNWKENILTIYEKGEKGENLPIGVFRTITFWCVDNDEFIGEVQLRPSLNDGDALLYGHIFYAIRYSKWGKGYGTKILELILNKAKSLGLKKVNIACHKDNIGSIRVIEKNNAKFIISNDEYNSNVYEVIFED